MRTRSRRPTSFQFTPLREGRPQVAFYVAYEDSISIHAPPRGATSCTSGSVGYMLFQFTPLREGRRLQMLIIR